MNKSTISLFRIVIIVVAPVVLLASFIYHPHVGNPIDADFLEKLAGAVADDTTRWGVAHLMAGIAIGLLMLAFIAIRGHLRDTGEERWSTIGLPFIILGSTLYIMLPGMEFAPMAAAKTGADIQGAQAAIMPWFAPIIMSSAILNAIGAISFAIGIVSSGILKPKLSWLVAAALVVMAAARFVPLNAVQFYVQSVAFVVALWPLAYVIWKDHYIRHHNAYKHKPSEAILNTM